MGKKFYSPEFESMQRYLHSDATMDEWKKQGAFGWGAKPRYVFTDTNNQVKSINELIELAQPKTLIDYGCGKGFAADDIAKSFPDIDVRKFDPFVEPYSTHPTEPVDMVVSVSVLQQIEPEHIESVIDDIYNLTLKNLLVEVIISKEYLDTMPEVWLTRFNKFKLIFSTLSEEVQQKRPSGIDSYTDPRYAIRSVKNQLNGFSARKFYMWMEKP